MHRKEIIKKENNHDDNMDLCISDIFICYRESETWQCLLCTSMSNVTPNIQVSNFSKMPVQFYWALSLL